MSLLTTLQIANQIVNEETASTQLVKTYGISTRTLRNHIKEARHLGVDIQTRRITGGKTGKVVYYASNAEQIKAKGTLEKWLQLEMDRSVT